METDLKLLFFQIRRSSEKYRSVVGILFCSDFDAFIGRNPALPIVDFFNEFLLLCIAMNGYRCVGKISGRESSRRQFLFNIISDFELSANKIALDG